MSQTKPEALKKISQLVRKPIVEKAGEYVFPSHKKTVGTHGTHVPNVVDLAIYGRFIDRGRHLEGNFFLTPNSAYAKWAEYGLDEKLNKYGDYDDFEAAIAYSEMITVDEAYREVTAHPEDDGVVITFSSRALQKGAEIQPGYFHEYPELVLPEAPSIESIAGIYPVEQNAANMLRSALEKIQ